MREISRIWGDLSNLPRFPEISGDRPRSGRSPEICSIWVDLPTSSEISRDREISGDLPDLDRSPRSCHIPEDLPGCDRMEDIDQDLPIMKFIVEVIHFLRKRAVSKTAKSS
jgi:hypothetical protein